MQTMSRKLERTFGGLSLLTIAVILAAPAHAQLSDAEAARLSQNADQRVIVILKSQHAAAAMGGEAAAARAALIDAEQAPLMDELGQVQAKNVKRFRLVSSFAATVSKDEVARLKAHPLVAQVLPDVTIHRKQRPKTTVSKSTSPAAASAALALNVIPGACGPGGAVLLDPEGLKLTHSVSDDPNEPTARSLGFTGAGVKVAWIADGIDPNNVNFIRPDNTSVFIDYQDFSGDGPGRLTDGGEAFLDANTIAGQGIHVYNVSGFSAQPDPSACNIRIEGVAPGASLVGLDVLGSFEDFTMSNILQAIDYAVQTDHVDVINESLGIYNFPDVTSLDVFKQFDDAAVASGVVVTAASFDAGSTNTISSPASDPLLISVGASTDFRFYAQTNYVGVRYFATTGWLSDNISSISSGGFTETGNTMDLVAPGDLSFASCDASPLFEGCTNFLGQSSDIETAGGTSESSPFVAGAAALVIQAYRQTHGGASPTPALVKQVLLSTATDLGEPATEQGAGLLNSYKAVLLAESIQTEDGSPTRIGNTLLLSANQLNAVGNPGTVERWNVTVTNSGAFTQFVNLSGRSIGPDQNVQTGSVILNDSSSPKFVDAFGVLNNYEVVHFQVPPGADRLNASFAYPGNPATSTDWVNMILVDPQGRFAAYAWPQGIGNFAQADVRFPTPGTWTGIISCFVGVVGGVTGTIPWRVETEKFAWFGWVSPNNLVLAPGQTETVTVSATTPPSPGDAAGAIVLTSNFGLGGTTSIPVTLRSLIDVANGGSFHGVLTGGNGRPPGEGQLQYYEFNVWPGVRNIAANVSLANDPNDPVGAYLISPDGYALGFGQNSLNGTNGNSLSAYTLHPIPGTWTMILDFAEPVVGNEISQPYAGNVRFNQDDASVSGLPESVSETLAAGTPVNVLVTITNNGAAPEDFFVDARLDEVQDVALPALPPTTETVVLPNTSYSPTWLIPTETLGFSISQTSTVPAMFDYEVNIGDPWLASASFGSGPLCALSESATFSPFGRRVTPGFWYAEPTECGPYASPAPTGSTTITMTAQTKAFDPAVTSTTGDLWLASINPAYALFSPVVINPGQTSTILVTITPSGPSGTLVRGTLYVDDYVSAVPPYAQVSGDELAGFHYSYTIK
jgi:hypothetical protein